MLCNTQASWVGLKPQTKLRGCGDPALQLHDKTVWIYCKINSNPSQISLGVHPPCIAQTSNYAHSSQPNGRYGQ